MEQNAQTDYFNILEEKVESLIDKIKSMKEEKESFIRKIQDQESRIADLDKELGRLKEVQDQAKDRIGFILERIDNLGV
jgi:FtsZ-binding cell division protein ZapB